MKPFNVMTKLERPHLIEWFYLIVGLFFVLRYCWFLDDAFVYFRYVDNLLFFNLGLVYNQGEFVEGFSSPFWIMLLIFMRFAYINWWIAIQLIACFSFIIFWMMLVKLNRKLSPKGIILNFPLAYLAVNYGVLCYFSSGLETPLVQIMAIAYALYIVNPASTRLQILLAISPLIRPELLVSFALCVLWGWWYQKKIPLKMILYAAFGIGLLLIFRIYYYADLFPNTFYLKDNFNIKQGLIYVQDTLRTYYFYHVICIFLVLVILLKRKFNNVELAIAKRAMMLLVAISSMLYVIKIGGGCTALSISCFPFLFSDMLFGWRL